MKNLLLDLEIRGGTIGYMAKPRKPPGKTKKSSEDEPVNATKKPVRYGSPLRIWIPPKLRRHFDRLSHKGRRTLTAEIVMAMEAHLHANGIDPESDPGAPEEN